MSGKPTCTSRAHKVGITHKHSIAVVDINGSPEPHQASLIAVDIAIPGGGTRVIGVVVRCTERSPYPGRSNARAVLVAKGRQPAAEAPEAIGPKCSSRQSILDRKYKRAGKHNVVGCVATRSAAATTKGIGG